MTVVVAEQWKPVVTVHPVVIVIPWLCLLPVEHYFASTITG
jgi:hypothetical protein